MIEDSAKRPARRIFNMDKTILRELFSGVFIKISINNKDDLIECSALSVVPQRRLAWRVEKVDYAQC